jgi:D-alanyl-D-alanine dipeptidase
MDRISPKDVLVDVIALSLRSCTQPIQGCLAYATRENFVGRVIAGYHPDAQDVCLVTPKVAQQLCLIQNALVNQGLSLFIFDAYRPLRAVQDWMKWYRQPLESEYEKERKKVHYPHLEKEDLVRLGYAPDTVSQHCFGHVVDVSLVRLQDGQLLNMGTAFDYFGSSSHLDAGIEAIGEEAAANRELLVNIMQKFGFNPYICEWWHFEYQEKEVHEPMDLEITPDLKN